MHMDISNAKVNFNKGYLPKRKDFILTWMKETQTFRVNVKKAKRNKNSHSAQYYFPSHKTSDLKMRPCCLWNCEAWLQASWADRLTAFNKTIKDLIILWRKQEEKCSSLTMLSGSTPPRTAYFCTRACAKIHFLRRINNNKGELAWTAIFAWPAVRGVWVIPSHFASKEAFPSLTCVLAVVPHSWVVPGACLTSP